MKKSQKNKAAWICFAGVIIAAIITAIFNLPKQSDTTPKAKTRDQFQSPHVVMGESAQLGDININYFVPATDTTTTYKKLEKKLNSTSKEIALNRQEIEWIVKALKDLDHRTSGIEKLPDGRSKFGNLITGHPFIVIEEQNIAATLLRRNDFTNAFQHAKHAIEAYESSQRNVSMQTGVLEASNVAKLYYVGAMSAHKLEKHDLALQWAEKANKEEPNPKRLCLVVITRININEIDKALEIINQGLKMYPGNQDLNLLKQEITKKNGFHPAKQ